MAEEESNPKSEAETQEAPQSKEAPPGDASIQTNPVAEGSPAPSQEESQKAVKTKAPKSKMKSVSKLKDLPVLEVFKSLLSDDLPTRKMSVFFVLSLFGFVAVFTIGIDRLWIIRKNKRIRIAQEAALLEQEQLKKKAEEEQLNASLVSLGKFQVQLAPHSTDPVLARVIHIAELEIIVLCNDGDAKNFIKENIAQARNQLTNVFLVVERDDLMTRVGKRRIKTQILKKLNGWLPSGKVEEVYFSKLLLS